MTHDDVEQLLGSPVDRGLPLRGQTFSLSGGLDYRVSYGALTVPPERTEALWAAAGLATSAARAFTAVLMPAGWRVEPGDPPSWWPTDPSGLRDLRARPLVPGGWLAMGYADGTAYLLATQSGTRDA
ncbi:hypothetical protein GB881_04535 [Georgenia subflava]|uniref:Uncharacterized protein n=1 Tax=Georgenia subflava TaxID=1622177 RepID=A0A6N7EGM6_9MICO|nr:hypothetical protein [Georgenia subflava]